jgi:hypothetical protein
LALLFRQGWIVWAVFSTGCKPEISLQGIMDDQDYSSAESITGGVKTVSYSVNGEGEYELVSGPGWQPVNVVNRQAWLEIEKSIAASREKVESGRVSCLHYYMTANQMDIGLLARYTNQSRWQVRLHLIPLFYRRLGQETLQKYGHLFQVSPDELKSGRLKAPVYDSGKQGRATP